MKLTMLASLALLFASEAAPEKAKSEEEKKAIVRLTLVEEIQKLLPRGWSLETKGLPSGVAGVALGPRTAAGRAVVMVSVLDNGARDEELTDTDARAFLAESVQASPVAGRVPGAAEFAAVAPVSGGEDRLVRYLVASGKPAYLLTLVAPKSSFDATYRQVVEIATRLRRSTSKR